MLIHTLRRREKKLIEKKKDYFYHGGGWRRSKSLTAIAFFRFLSLTAASLKRPASLLFIDISTSNVTRGNSSVKKRLVIVIVMRRMSIRRKRHRELFLW